jgi:hypothetical protein
MPRKQFESEIKYLNDLMNRYHQPYQNFRNGKNKKIRDLGERQSDSIRTEFEMYLNRNNNLHQEFMEVFKEFAYEEALSWNYFHRDMPRFINHLNDLD